MSGPLLWLLERLGALLYRAGLASFVIGLRPDAVRVLLYHACEAVEDDFLDGLGSNVPPARFSEHMEFVRRSYNVVAVDTLADPDRPRRAAAITFDDGYRSVLTDAAPILASRRLPFAVYLVTEVVDNRNLVWVNELNWMLRRHGGVVGPLVRETIGADQSDSTVALIDAARARLRPDAIASLLAVARRRLGTDAGQLASERRLYLEWDDVHALRSLGATIGNHTASHPSLPLLDPVAVQAQVRTAHEVIARTLGSCSSFAHPFGDVSDGARQCAVDLDYRTVMCVSGPQRPLHSDRVARVPALDVPVDRLFAAIEVVEPVKAWIRSFLPAPAR